MNPGRKVSKSSKRQTIKFSIHIDTVDSVIGIDGDRNYDVEASLISVKYSSQYCRKADIRNRVRNYWSCRDYINVTYVEKINGLEMSASFVREALELFNDDLDDESK